MARVRPRVEDRFKEAVGVLNLTPWWCVQQPNVHGEVEPKACPIPDASGVDQAARAVGAACSDDRHVQCSVTSDSMG